MTLEIMTLKVRNCGNGPFWVTDMDTRLTIRSWLTVRGWLTVRNRLVKRIRCCAMSQLYDTESDAVLVREWLEERAAGYPPNRVLVDEPQF